MAGIACDGQPFPRSPAARRCTFAALALLVILGLAVLFACNPARSSLFPPCPFHALTGLHCPGCGTLRALHHTLHGHLRAAFLLNPLMVLSIPLLTYLFASKCAQAAGRRGLPALFVSKVWIWVLPGTVILYWITSKLERRGWNTV